MTTKTENLTPWTPRERKTPPRDKYRSLMPATGWYVAYGWLHDDTVEGRWEPVICGAILDEPSLPRARQDWRAMSALKQSLGGPRCVDWCLGL